MAIIKQISVFDGNNWKTDDIGVDANNVNLGNVVLSDILPASTFPINRVLVSNGNGAIVTSNYTTTQLNSLDSNKVNKIGDNMTGNLQINRSSGDTYFIANRSDTDTKVGIGVGNSGKNHGLYSWKLAKWLIYGNVDGDIKNVYLSPNLHFTTDKNNNTTAKIDTNLTFDTPSSVVSRADLVLKNQKVTSDQKISANAWTNAIRFTDKNDVELARVGSYFNTNQQQYVAIKALRTPPGKSQIANELSLRITKDGTRVVNVSDAVAWRNALGASSTAGVWAASMIPDLAVGKITGILPINKGGTGASTVGAKKVFIGPTTGNAAPSFRVLTNNDIPTWAQYKKVTNQTPISINLTSYKEILIVATMKNYTGSIIIPVSFLDSNTSYVHEVYLGGWGGGSEGSSNRRAYCKLSKTSFEVGGIKKDGVDSTGTWYIYGR